MYLATILVPLVSLPKTLKQKRVCNGNVYGYKKEKKKCEKQRHTDVVKGEMRMTDHAELRAVYQTIGSKPQQCASSEYVC